MLGNSVSKLAAAARITSVASCFAAVGFLAMASTSAEAASPKDARIVFASDRTTGPGVHNPTGDFEIFTVDRDGKHARQLTFNTVTDEYPAYSPDGKYLAFSTDRDGNYEVYAMKANGSKPTNLTNNPASDREPAYSPNGKRMAFYTSRDSDYEVYEMKQDGSDQTDLTNAPTSDDYEPAWHPGKQSHRDCLECS
jgi:Tol biopolymer transport system component